MKGKGFFDILCSNLNYRLFAGIPVEEHKDLYDTMDTAIMHYIPTVNEVVALGVISGGILSGYKGAVLMGADNFNLLLPQFSNFNTKFKIPLMFIVNGDYNPLKLKQFKFEDDFNILYDIDNYINKYSKSSILIL